MNSSATRRSTVAVWALLFGATLAAYFPALRAGFIWNDGDYVTKPALRSLHGLARIWFEVGATEQYYPLLHSAFWFEHRLWGDAALGYHLVNVLLHATSACLLFVAVRKLTEEARAPIEVAKAPALAAFLFALHPICVESVAWISEQKNTLSTVFYLLALLAYLRWEAGGGRWEEKDINPSPPTSRLRPPTFYLVALALFLCAVLTKTVTAIFPGALLVIFWWKRGRLGWRRDVWPLIPFFAIGAASGLFSAWVERTYVGAEGADFALGFLQRALVAGHAVWFYLGRIIWPANLIFIYPRWTVSATNLGQYLWPLGVIALAAALWLLRKRTRAPLAAFLFFLGSLFPVCGFFNLYAFVYSYVADHWQYLPSIGVIVLAAGGWEKLAARLHWFRFIPVLVLAIFGILTYRQSGMYRDMETFYQRTIAKNPDCWMAENNLGDLYEHEGRLDRAADHYERSLQIKPSAKSHYNLGTVRHEQGRVEEAILEFEEALQISPQFADARNNLAGALEEAGRTDEAIGQLQVALRLDPGSPGVHSNLGIALASQGDADGAIGQFREAIRLDPNYAEAYSNLGAALRRQGRYTDAIVALRRALALKPRLPNAHVSIGIALALEGRLDEAAAEFREAIRIDPNYAEAHNDLGNALFHLGRPNQARAEFLEALRLRPNFPDARMNLEQIQPP